MYHRKHQKQLCMIVYTINFKYSFKIKTLLPTEISPEVSSTPSNDNGDFRSNKFINTVNKHLKFSYAFKYKLFVSYSN